MLALGIDPGTAVCGFGLVNMRGSCLKAVDFGVILTGKDQTPETRLAVIYEKITALIDANRPDIVAVEQLFFNRNVTTALAVGQARGVILLSAAHLKVKIAEYTPLQVKQSVTGYGRADKEQMMFMVQRLLGLKEKPRPDDAADALAIAVCALHSGGFCERVLSG
jgi:crossover junction endodeoxyribonuclease RuvC